MSKELEFVKKWKELLDLPAEQGKKEAEALFDTLHDTETERSVDSDLLIQWLREQDLYDVFNIGNGVLCSLDFRGDLHRHGVLSLTAGIDVHRSLHRDEGWRAAVNRDRSPWEGTHLRNDLFYEAADARRIFDQSLVETVSKRRDELAQSGWSVPYSTSYSTLLSLKVAPIELELDVPHNLHVYQCIYAYLLSRLISYISACTEHPHTFFIPSGLGTQPDIVQWLMQRHQLRPVVWKVEVLAE